MRRCALLLALLAVAPAYAQVVVTGCQPMAPGDCLAPGPCPQEGEQVICWDYAEQLVRERPELRFRACALLGSTELGCVTTARYPGAWLDNDGSTYGYIWHGMYVVPLRHWNAPAGSTVRVNVSACDGMTCGLPVEIVLSDWPALWGTP